MGVPVTSFLAEAAFVSVSDPGKVGTVYISVVENDKRENIIGATLTRRR